MPYSSVRCELMQTGPLPDQSSSSEVPMLHPKQPLLFFREPSVSIVIWVVARAWWRQPRSHAVRLVAMNSWKMALLAPFGSWSGGASVFWSGWWSRCIDSFTMVDVVKIVVAGHQLVKIDFFGFKLASHQAWRPLTHSQLVPTWPLWLDILQNRLPGAWNRNPVCMFQMEQLNGILHKGILWIGENISE
jgi:hypothetical protein